MRSLVLGSRIQTQQYVCGPFPCSYSEGEALHAVLIVPGFLVTIQSPMGKTQTRIMSVPHRGCGFSGSFTVRTADRGRMLTHC